MMLNNNHIFKPVQCSYLFESGVGHLVGSKTKQCVMSDYH